MIRRPSLDALAMAGAEWAEVPRAGGGEDNDEREAGAPPPPPEHLRAFEAFLEEVVPADMLLAFRREQGDGARRRTQKEDVQEKLKLWAKAVARKTREQASSRRGGNNRGSCAARIQCT